MHRYVRDTQAKPAAGLEVGGLPATAEPFKLLTLRATLVTSATVADRWPHFQFVTPSGDVFFECVPSAAQAASKTITYQLTADSGAPNEGSAVNDDVAGLSLPGFWMPDQTKVKTVTTAIDPADQWEGIYLTYLVRDDQGFRREVLELLEQNG